MIAFKLEEVGSPPPQVLPGTPMPVDFWGSNAVSPLPHRTWERGVMGQQ